MYICLDVESRMDCFGEKKGTSECEQGEQEQREGGRVKVER